MNNRPEITDKKIEEIKKLISEHPGMGRTKISVMLCEMWDWRDATNRTKDMSCRDMLRALEKAGKIVLPPRKTVTHKAGAPIRIKHLVHDETPIHCGLKELRPLQIRIVSTGEERTEFKSYIDQFHYLGFQNFVGERMAYMVYSCDGTALACLLFGAAAWSCKDRDKFIGWKMGQRKHNLSRLTDNVRFLIYPWVRVPHLASHILSLIAHRIVGDWQSKYGHPVYLLETFVEKSRFRGVCYRAANWICVGSTTGRGRDGGHHNAIVPVKDIYLYPLSPDYREKLCAKELSGGSKKPDLGE